MPTEWQVSGPVRDAEGKQHTRSFDLRRDAVVYMDERTAEPVAGTFVSPRKARTTVAEWCDQWLEGYRGDRQSTVRQAEVHIAKTKEAFGHRQLSQVKPSLIPTWCAQLKAEGYADSLGLAWKLTIEATIPGMSVRAASSGDCGPRGLQELRDHDRHPARQQVEKNIAARVVENVRPGRARRRGAGPRGAPAGGRRRHRRR